MKAHHLINCFAFVLLVTLTTPTVAGPYAPSSLPDTEARAALLNERLQEIKAMDKSDLAGSEKRALRKEVKEIKKELATMSGGVYLSVGAILLIALLLILLL